MKTFQTYVQEWEKNATKDAYWAVLTSSQFEKTTWNKELFFQSGREEIALLKSYIERMQLPIGFRGTALDFGCGTGRLSQALAKHFDKVCGVDISTTMIQKAHEALSPSLTNIEYKHNPHPHLQFFENNTFDFIYSNIVLQHIGKKHQKHYLKEFSRILKPKGWMIIQIPSQRIFSSFGQMIKGKLIACLPYALKKQILIHVLRNRTRAIKDFDFEINLSSEKSIQTFVAKHHLRLKHIVYTNSCESNFSGDLVFKSHEEAILTPGYLSPMYFIQK